MGEEKTEILYKDLSYQIVGVLYDVHNELGGKMKEKYYYKAIEKGFANKGIKFKSQAEVPIYFLGEKIGHYKPDFIIEDKIVLEIKRGNRFSQNNFNQVEEYLNKTGLMLAIMAIFTKEELRYTRTLNIY